MTDEKKMQAIANILEDLADKMLPILKNGDYVGQSGGPGGRSLPDFVYSDYYWVDGERYTFEEWFGDSCVRREDLIQLIYEHNILKERVLQEIFWMEPEKAAEHFKKITRGLRKNAKGTAENA